MPQQTQSSLIDTFGMTMPGRTLNPSDYRYGFNGKEEDTEYGTTTVYDYGFRVYSTSLGKFLSTDPFEVKFPWYTPYQYAGNKPIWAIDLEGLEEWKVTENYDDRYGIDMILVTAQSEVLTEIVSSVTLSERQDDYVVYLTVGGTGGANGITLTGVEKLVEQALRAENAGETYSGEYKKIINKFDIWGLDWDELKEDYLAGKEIAVISVTEDFFVDEWNKNDLSRMMFTMFHEIQAHLRPSVEGTEGEGVPKGMADGIWEHIVFYDFEYKASSTDSFANEDFYTDDEIDALFENRSPDINHLKPGSKAAEIKDELDKGVQNIEGQ